MNYQTLTMSEKFDGVQARWDGESLVSRDGNRFDAPDWFVAGLPDQPLIGELWIGRGQFEQTVGVVRSLGGGQRWRDVRYLVFDGPDGLDLGDHAEYIQQKPCRDQASVDRFYEDVLARGGEGIMLRDPDGNCTKRKPVGDDDGVVVAHREGKGRNAGRLGALVVRDAAGREFRLGAGLSDRDRSNPPPVGTIVKYTFQGRTRRGVPRFASYLGMRAEASLV